MRAVFQKLRRRKYFFSVILIAAIALVATTLGLSLMIDILEKKAEGKHAFVTLAEINDDTEDPALWGVNFPIQFESYLKTADQVRTRYGGSEAVPRTPSKADPRSIVAQSRLEEDPRLKIIWDGYAFSKDFREERGHAFMLEDQLYTERQKVVQQPGACVNCHASTYVPMKKLGAGDLKVGFHKLNEVPYAEAKNHVKHPVGCIDCHTPVTMELRVTRPAFMEGIKAYKNKQGIKNYDVNQMASHQEMRTFVCAQCHVEYYFKGKEKTLTFPWANGILADEILDYYEKNQHKDWIHKRAGTHALKAQHPEFELWSQGIHARSGVSCADCHMPYQRVGAAKVTDHHVRSPLLNVGKACQTCHRWPEAELISRVEMIQTRTQQVRAVAMDAVVDLIQDIEKASSAPQANDYKINQARSYHRKAQFLLDFVEAENSSGFHAPQEAMRLLGLSIDFTRRGQKALRN